MSEPELPAVESPPSSPENTRTPDVALETSVQNALRTLHEAERTSKSRLQETAEAQKLAAEYKALQESAKENPATLLEKFGLSLEDLDALRTETVDPFQQTTQSVQEIREELAAMKAAKKAEADQLAYEQVRQAVHQSVSTEDYPMINTFGVQAKDIVYQRVVSAYENGTPISESQAASEVEKELEGLRNLLLGEKVNEPKSSPDTLTNPMAGTNANKLNYRDLTLAEQDALFTQRLSNLK